eukprot:TRINITY_DN893_c0_g2_i18.p1 TRINITY_DN893_c0_g2~~TRINITY_DN893_c0_g2_i18.p1  ORF type:complete len:127 (-),score=9.88 TRINITY_DN893_c0_g2_i18:176-556(-)
MCIRDRMYTASSGLYEYPAMGYKEKGDLNEVEKVFMSLPSAEARQFQKRRLVFNRLTTHNNTTRFIIVACFIYISLHFHPPIRSPDSYENFLQEVQMCHQRKQASSVLSSSSSSPYTSLSLSHTYV